MDDLKRYIREVPDFPRAGILFYDITTLMQDPLALRMTVDRLSWLFVGERVDKVVGMESRGFIFALIVAASLNAGFVPVRKPGKLPSRTVNRSYALEYGKDMLEMHADAIGAGERVLVIDDLIATGGTALATAEMIEAAGGVVAGLGFVIELQALEGRQRLGKYPVKSLIVY
jgi:adenine phosphoribosyltransferase